MSDMPSAAPDSEAVQIGIPLDLAPLLTPYGHYQRLSLRVVQLPPLVRLSKGMVNDDRNWSLTPADLEGLELLLPEETPPPIAVAIRIIGIDKNNNATIIGQFDVPLFAISGAATAVSSEVNDAPPAASLADAEARWEVKSARRLSEQAARLEADWQQKVASERAAREAAEAATAEARQKLTGLSEKLAAVRARAEAAEAEAARQVDDGRRAVEAAEARLSQELVRQLAAERVRCEAQSEKDIAAAVKKAEALAKARLQDARDAWESETQAAVAAAEVKLRSDYARQFATARAEWQKEALAAAGKGRRKLRSVAKKQSLGNAGRAVLRLGLVAGCLAAGVFLYTEFRPAILSQWLPKGLELVGDIESAARAQLESLVQTPQQKMAVAAEVANLRDGPSTAREVLTTLPRSTVVSVLERQGDWLRVDTGGGASRQGWLHHSLLEAAR